MKLRKQILITASIALSLYLASSFAVAASITKNETIIDSPVTGDVTGNSGGSGTTNLSDPAIVPPSGSNSNVYDNSVAIEDGGAVKGKIYGGITYGNGNVYKNTVTVYEGGSPGSQIYGGYSKGNGNVYENTVIINEGVKSSSNIWGGMTTGNGNVYGNTVIINGTITGIWKQILGGDSQGDGNVYNNSIFFNGTADREISVMGARASKGDVYDNIVVINGSLPKGWVYGGMNYARRTIGYNNSYC